MNWFAAISRASLSEIKCSKSALFAAVVMLEKFRKIVPIPAIVGRTFSVILLLAFDVLGRLDVGEPRPSDDGCALG